VTARADIVGDADSNAHVDDAQVVDQFDGDRRGDGDPPAVSEAVRDHADWPLFTGMFPRMPARKRAWSRQGFALTVLVRAPSPTPLNATQNTS
jgi:hypothetical protein